MRTESRRPVALTAIYAVNATPAETPLHPDQRRGEPVDRLRPAQRRAHVPLVAPQPPGRDEDLRRREPGRDRRAVLVARGEPGERDARPARPRTASRRAQPRAAACAAAAAARRRAAISAPRSRHRPARRRPARARSCRRSARAARPARPGRARRPRAAPPSRAPWRTSARRAGCGSSRDERRGVLAVGRELAERLVDDDDGALRAAARTGRAARRGANARARRVGRGAQEHGARGRVRRGRGSRPAPGGTGTARPPAASTSAGQRLPARPARRARRRRRASSAAHARAQQLARAVPERDLLRADAVPLARAPRAARSADRSGYALSARRSANVAALTASGCGGSCHSRAGQVERLDPAERAALLLVAAGAQLQRDLLGRHLLELPVVLAEPPHRPLSAARSRSRGPR